MNYKNIILCLLLWPIINVGNGQRSVQTIEYAASTPCDNFIKDLLNINQNDSIDFVRWRLSLTFLSKQSGTFTAHINYGLSKPNTLGFIDGSTTKEIQGIVSIRLNSGIRHFILEDNGHTLKLALAELSENVIHMLDNKNKLAVGNGGWSYAFNRSDSIMESDKIPDSFSALDVNVANSTLTFVGRTPCEPLSTEYNLGIADNCLKIKWVVRLYVDPITKRPTSFNIHRTGHRTKMIEGTWSIIQESNSIICRLNQRTPLEPMYLWVASEDVLHFLDKKRQIMNGDENFSFVLNRVHL